MSITPTREEIGFFFKTQLNLKTQFKVMDQVENQRSSYISLGKFTATTRFEGLASIFNHLHRTPIPPTKFMWTLLFPPKVQFFLWKALTEGHLTFDSYIPPRCNPDPKSAILLENQVDVDYWFTTIIVTDESWGIIYPCVKVP